MSGRLRAQRFRHEQAALADAIGGLLGRAANKLESAELREAESVNAEFIASWEAQEERDHAVVSQTWPQAEIERAIDTVHRIAQQVGDRSVWLVIALTEPHALSLSSEAILDNPLGFAALGDHELRLLDRELPAGLWLLRHSLHPGAAQAQYSWELTVWGEPWASAATRVLRGP